MTRFAPSPTGYLHLGHAYAALFAAARGERFLLRIEDLDQGRCRPEFTKAIFEDLVWLGLRWAEPVWHQSGRADAYQQALAELGGMGLLYACTCTRKEIQAEVARMGGAPHPGEAVRYPGSCRNKGLPLDGGGALRLDMEKAVGLTTVVGAEPWGDVVLARRDLGVAYHLAVVVDDAAQGVTLVTRGEDMRDQRPIHEVLQRLFGLPIPRYEHHPLVHGADGKRLAKRDQAHTLRALRGLGWDADRVAEALFVNQALPR